MGIGQAGHLARIRHRRHPDRLAEAGRGLSRSVFRRRTRPRRGTQLGDAAEHHRGDRAEEDHAARENPGTIKLWPGVAEELLATKAYYVRDGYFKDTDVVIFTHIGSNWGVNWGDGTSNGLVSVEYTFKGESAHSAGAPWRGRSALDAAMLMDIGWNYRREHLRIQQRSHSVITFGGNQPNVVPPSSSIWYYFRETDYPNIKRMWEIGDNMAKAAALMTDTTMTSRVLGIGVAAAHEQGRRRNGVREHREGRHAGVDRRRSDAGEGRAERAGCRGERSADRGAEAERTRRGSRRREAGRRIGRHRRHLVGRADDHAAVSRPTSKPVPVTTGRTRLPWRRRSRTRA